MSDQELLERYMLQRILQWRRDLAILDADTVAKIVKVMVAVERDIIARFNADADGIASLTEWRKEHDAKLKQWLDTVTAGAQQTATTVIGENVLAAGEATTQAYNAILSFDGVATGVNTVGITRAQMAALFTSTSLGSAGLGNWVKKALTVAVQDSILEAIQKAVVEGKGTATAVRQVMRAAVGEGMNIARRDAITLTRTAIQTANIQAQERIFNANNHLIKGYKWVATLDNRTCIRCALLDCTEYGLNEERPPMPLHPRCVVGETPVFAPDKVAAFVSTYNGPVFEVTLANGARCTVTANHMFLARNGFTPANALRKGDYIFSDSSKVLSGTAVIPNNNGRPSRIDDIVEAMSKASGMTTVSVPTTPEYLHGNGKFFDSNVDVVLPNSLLRGDLESFRREYVKEDFFTGTVKSSSSFPAECYFPDEFLALWLALDCHISGSSIFDVFSLCSSGHHQSIGVCESSNFNANLFENLANGKSGHVVPFSKSILGHSIGIQLEDFISGNSFRPSSSLKSEFFESPNDRVARYSKVFSDVTSSLKSGVSLSQVVSIKEKSFHGKVYDLQTISSLYYANGMVSSNCRCVLTPICKSWKDFGFKNVREFRDTARPWAFYEQGNIDEGGRRKILNAGRGESCYKGWWFSLSEDEQKLTPIGKHRSALLRKGAVEWGDLYDKRTGNVRTLESMGYDRRIVDVDPFLLKRSFNKGTDVAEIVNFGKKIYGKLPSAKLNPERFFDALTYRLKYHVGTGLSANIQTTGETSDILAAASQRFPSSWVKFGQTTPLMAIFTNDRPCYNAGKVYLDNKVTTAVHEYAHFLQRVVPGLDKKFQDLHKIRTGGDKLERLADLLPKDGYGMDELTRKDNYFHPYMGKSYGASGALDVMSMAFQTVLGYDKNTKDDYHNSWARNMATIDPEMLHFTLGLLFGWK